METKLYLIGTAILIIIFKTFRLFSFFRKKTQTPFNKVKKTTKQAAQEKAEAEKILKKINSRPERKKVRDKYSSIIVGIVIIFLSISLCSGDYIVYDKEDKVYRNYGDITNYVKSLEEEKEIFLENEYRYNLAISKYSNAYVKQSNVIVWQQEEIDRNKKNWFAQWWEDNDLWIGIITGVIILNNVK